MAGRNRRSDHRCDGVSMSPNPLMDRCDRRAARDTLVWRITQIVGFVVLLTVLGVLGSLA